MEILEIKVRYGMTQNLGDYTNCRSEVEVSARPTAGDDVAESVLDLVNLAREQVREIVDDEMEAAGQAPKYYNGRLLKVAYSERRNCIVVYPECLELSQEKNWKEGDYWNSAGIYHAMRPETAVAAAVKLGERYPNMMLVNCAGGDFSELPPLPDPGPEPLWSKKDLRNELNGLHIDEAEWEIIAALEHVTGEYLNKVRRWAWNHSHTQEDLLAIIRENRPLEVAEPDDDDDDEDWMLDDDDD
jgi:hypothetical protein